MTKHNYVKTLGRFIDPNKDAESGAAVKALAQYCAVLPSRVADWQRQNAQPSPWHQLLLRRLDKNLSKLAPQALKTRDASSIEAQTGLPLSHIHKLAAGQKISLTRAQEILLREALTEWGACIKDFRQMHNVSLERLASAAGFQRLVLSEVEAGRRVMNTHDRERISFALEQIGTVPLAADADHAKAPVAVPPPRPSAIRPKWSKGKLELPSDLPASSLSSNQLFNALKAIKADIEELVSDIDEESQNAREAGRNLNIDSRPLRQLRRVAERITDNTIAAHELLRIFHAADAMFSYSGVVAAEWPDFLAARYNVLAVHIRTVASQFQDWRDLKAIHVSAAQIREIPEAVDSLVQMLKSEDGAALVEPAVPEALNELTRPILESEPPEVPLADPMAVIDAATEALAADVINAMENIVQQLARAALALRDGPAGALAAKVRDAAWKGFEDELPKQSEKLVRLIAKLSVWGAATAVTSAMAAQFGWFAPIAKLIAKMLS